MHGADSPEGVTHYRVPLHLDDHHFTRSIAVYGPRDLTAQLAQLAADFPDYEIGTPRQVAA